MRSRGRLRADEQPILAGALDARSTVAVRVRRATPPVALMKRGGCRIAVEILRARETLRARDVTATVRVRGRRRSACVICGAGVAVGRTARGSAAVPVRSGPRRSANGSAGACVSCRARLRLTVSVRSADFIRRTRSARARGDAVIARARTTDGRNDEAHLTVRAIAVRIARRRRWSDSAAAHGIVLTDIAADLIGAVGNGATSAVAGWRRGRAGTDARSAGVGGTARARATARSRRAAAGSGDVAGSSGTRVRDPSVAAARDSTGRVRARSNCSSRRTECARRAVGRTGALAVAPATTRDEKSQCERCGNHRMHDAYASSSARLAQVHHRLCTKLIKE